MVEGYRLPSFFATCKNKEDSILMKFLRESHFQKISNVFFHVVTTKHSPFIKSIFRPQLCLFSHSPFSFVNIFHLFISNIKEVRFPKQLPNKRFTISPLNNFKTNNLITKRKKLKVRMNKRYKNNSSINRWDDQEDHVHKKNTSQV